MSINKQMDKEVVVHIYNEILVSHKKEWIWVGWTEVDELKACFTDWSKSGRGKQVSFIIMYIWNLEKWTYLQGRNRGTDTENRCVDSRGRQRVEKGNHIKNEKTTYGMG